MRNHNDNLDFQKRTRPEIEGILRVAKITIDEATFNAAWENVQGNFSRLFQVFISINFQMKIARRHWLQLKLRLIKLIDLYYWTLFF